MRKYFRVLLPVGIVVNSIVLVVVVTGVDTHPRASIFEYDSIIKRG